MEPDSWYEFFVGFWRGIGLFIMMGLWGYGTAAASGRLECPSIDLRTVFSLKMRDQGNVSWCYAHAAADYLQFYNRIPEPISAADIAIRYNQGLWARFKSLFSRSPVPETGFVRSALLNTQSEGYCPEVLFPSDFWKKVHRNGPVPRVERKRLKDAVRDIYRLHEWVRAGIFKSVNELPFIYEFPTVGHNEFFEALTEPRRRNVLNALRVSACSGNRKALSKSIDRITMRFRAGPGFSRIHQALARGIPVSADFFKGLLYHPDDVDVAISELHTALVVAQRYSEQGKQCEYLIKDSYGSGCKRYSRRWQCENGNIWVGERAFRKALVSTVVIEE
jgi:hypothetical protein